MHSNGGERVDRRRVVSMLYYIHNNNNNIILVSYVFIRKKIQCAPRSTHANDRQWDLIYEDVYFFSPSNKNEIILLLLLPLLLLFLRWVRELVSREKHLKKLCLCTPRSAMDVL